MQQILKVLHENGANSTPKGSVIFPVAINKSAMIIIQTTFLYIYQI